MSESTAGAVHSARIAELQHEIACIEQSLYALTETAQARIEKAQSEINALGRRAYESLRRRAEGICPNGHGPMRALNAFEVECPSCHFRDTRDQPHGLSR